MKSKEWHKRQSTDLYVKKATELGYVSRSAFKLIEIDKKYNILRKSDSILELGSAPGGWTQVILEIKKNKKYKLICIDKNDINIPIKNFTFIKEDFNNYEKILNKIDQKKFDLILSDISPNTTGHSNTDHLQIIQFAEDILKFSENLLTKNGSLIIKIFQGSHEKNFIQNLKGKFKSVKYFKPDSSRKSSVEIYIICQSLF